MGFYGDNYGANYAKGPAVTTPPLKGGQTIPIGNIGASNSVKLNNVSASDSISMGDVKG